MKAQVQAKGKQDKVKPACKKIISSDTESCSSPLGQIMEILQLHLS